MKSAILADTRARFLIAGGSAALLNWLVRFPLGLVVPYPAALLFAQAIGMAYGFVIYRSWAFRSSRRRSIFAELRDFLAVNAAGAALTIGLAVAAETALSAILPGENLAQALAHALGIAAGAVTNYLGHRHITFRP